jgi:hypothetical protein
MFSLARLSLVLPFALVIACSASSASPGDDAGDADAGAATDPVDAGADEASADDASAGDGTPVRQACTDTYGDAMTTDFGRIDGTIVAIVPSTAKTCRGSATHVSLQIQVDGAIYNAALNIDGLETSLTHAAVGDPFQEGWHPGGSFDYVTDLGVHADAFATTDEAALEQMLAQANHVSVWETGYANFGGHLVHRTRGAAGTDGALVLSPLSSSPTYVVFRFADQTF